MRVDFLRTARIHAVYLVVGGRALIPRQLLRLPRSSRQSKLTTAPVMGGGEGVPATKDGGRDGDGYVHARG